MKTKQPKQIWIVYGETGEYSDYCEWTVAAYTDEEMANKHKELALKWYQENRCHKLRYDKEFIKNPYDKNMSIQYTGTNWGVYPVTLFSSIPEELLKADNEQ